MSPKNQQDGGAPERVTLWVDVDGQVATEMEFGDDEPVAYVPESALDQARAEAFEEAAELVKLDGKLGAIRSHYFEGAAKAARERGGKVEEPLERGCE